MSDDPHAPTTAGPEPDEAASPAVDVPEAAAPDAAPSAEPVPEPAPFAPPAAAEPEPEPTPVVPPSEASWRTPPGTAAPAGGGSSAGDRPEIDVAKAFAGGVAAALLLKVLSR